MQNNPKIATNGFVRLNHLLKIFPISRSTWWAGVKTGRFPKPVKISSNITAWRIEDINSLLAELEQKRQGNELS